MKSHFKQFGWCILKNHVSDPEEVANSIVEETVKCIFGDSEEIKIVIDNKINPLLLLTDTKLRTKWLSNPKSIWYNNNSRTPKVSKNAGMINIYHNPIVRDSVLFNETIYSSICDLYHSLRGKKEHCIYLYGPDRVGIKSTGSTDMPKHIDCNILSLLDLEKTQTEIKRTAPTSPLLMPRIQAVACLSCDIESKHNGNTEVLSGYHHYFELGALFFKDKISPKTDALGGRKFVPIQLEDILKKHLESFIVFVKTFYQENIKIRGIVSELFSDYLNNSIFENSIDFDALYQRLPDNFIPIEWVKPLLNPGDVFCFDQRLPHRNTKNTSNKARIVAYISLYPRSYMSEDQTGDDIRNLFLRTSTERKTYSNPEERTVFQSVWEERVSFTQTLLTNKIMGYIQFVKRRIVLDTS